MTSWLEVHGGHLPLIVSFPHTGIEIPVDIEGRIASPWLARKDADWWVHRLYDFASKMGATTVRTAISRTVIDVNRDPEQVPLYAGVFSTGLCPLTTFDGEPLYRAGAEPDGEQIQRRRAMFFDPYHAALSAELRRLRDLHPRVVLYDAHSIRSRVPRLFDGLLPNFNIGTYEGRSCDRQLALLVEQACEHPSFTQVTNGRFKGGWTTRHYGQPQQGLHAIQMELACRSYMNEPSEPLSAMNWPQPFVPRRAAAVREILARVLQACLQFAGAQERPP